MGFVDGVVLDRPKVLAGLDVKVELQGTFEMRDYCVQYRESDFAFASRLMEGSMQEGEELEHPWLNRSIESAQK